MYHYISEPPAGADVYRQDLSVTPADFEAQLSWLRSQGYEGITLTDLVYHLALGWSLPDKPVILTFDDGYRDNYTNAFPLLKKYDYVGTFFLVTRPIDEGDPAYLTWDMVKEMHQAGMVFGPHGYRHYDLAGAPRRPSKPAPGRRPAFFPIPPAATIARRSPSSSRHIFGGLSPSSRLRPTHRTTSLN
ncbi:MAG: polysaccharide deacetylase family protein [Anaerolineae bacterium]